MVGVGVWDDIHTCLCDVAIEPDCTCAKHFLLNDALSPRDRNFERIKEEAGEKIIGQNKVCISSVQRYIKWILYYEEDYGGQGNTEKPCLKLITKIAGCCGVQWIKAPASQLTT